MRIVALDVLIEPIEGLIVVKREQKNGVPLHEFFRESPSFCSRWVRSDEERCAHRRKK